jgi:hypothetical protein
MHPTVTSSGAVGREAAGFGENTCASGLDAMTEA